MSRVDRNVLQGHLEYDLSSFLKGRMSFGPVPPWDLMKVSEQLRNLNRKANDEGVTDELRKAAIAKFFNIQEELAHLDVTDNPLLVRARHIIAQWLPPLEFCEEELWSSCRFGPGTVFHAKSEVEKSLSSKIGWHQTVTPKAKKLALRVIRDYFPSLAKVLSSTGARLTTVRGNRLAFVPKDAAKCRLIAVEPSLNIFLQLGVGSFLVNLMRKLGVSDLRENQALHRELVKEFEVWGTIDLSDASDRISIAVVKALLPPDWFELLDALRSHEYLCEDEWGVYSSFSSQGNAFTFPLETMIFKAIAVAASERKVHVYGDDIIAPVESCSSIASALESFGFVVNTQKSFWGQHEDWLVDFRESCGEDTLRGRSVRSVYYKDPATHESEIVALCNMLYEKWGFLPRTHEYLVHCCEKVPFTGPSSYATACERGGWNSVSKEYSSWLWWEIGDELGLPREPWVFSRHLQTKMTRLKYYTNKAMLLPAAMPEEVYWLEFLYSGSTRTSPLSKRSVGRKTITQFCLVS